MPNESAQPAGAVPLPPPPFLDVPALLELSRPQPRNSWAGYLAMVGVALFLSTLFTASDGAATAVAYALILGLTGVSIGTFAAAVSRHRRQFQAVEAVEELVQLRRWEPAGILLNKFLATPVRSPRVWARALVQLSAVLARHHRFADALTVDDFLLDDDGLLDDTAAYGVRGMRAMALLREDRLLDADRAISDLRRRGPRTAGPVTLIEIYRDVKTGHPAEAIEMFAARLDTLRQHLGHRVADAHALVARAYDLLGRDAEAGAAYARATALAPAAELHRRYPELAALVGKYPPTAAPPEVA